LDLAGFLRCLNHIGSLAGLGGFGEEHEGAMDLGSKIFGAFAGGGSLDSSKVDFAELTSGLSVFCNASTKEKVITIFTIHDSDGDGKLSIEETVHYVTCVFKVLFTACPAISKSFGSCSAEELAVVTVVQCFEEAGLGGEGVGIGIGELLGYFSMLNM